MERNLRDDPRVRLWAGSGVYPIHRAKDRKSLFAHERWAAAYAKAQDATECGKIVALLSPKRGNGKTQIGVELIRESCRHGHEARYVLAREIGMALRECYRRPDQRESDVLDRFIEPRLLVIDEIQERPDTESEMKLLTMIVDKRWGHELPTVLIANLGLQEFAAHVGPSVCDRLRDGGGVIEFDWSSFRGA